MRLEVAITRLIRLANLDGDGRDTLSLDDAEAIRVVLDLLERKGLTHERDTAQADR